MSVTSSKSITADELLKMGDIGRCELIYGELVMMSPAGLEHGAIASRILALLQKYVDAHDLGAVFAAETGFKVASNPDLVRAPDVSFIQKSRLPRPLPKGFFDGAPDLAVEVISPGESRSDVAEKVNMWLAHGAISVWVADPTPMTLTLYRTAQKPIRLTAHDHLRNDPTLPGFSITVSKFFKRP